MDKTKRMNSDEIIDLLAKRQKKTKKIPITDLQLSLPEQYIKKVDKVNYIYVGLNKYQIKYDNSSTFALTSYISRILNNTYYFVTRFNLKIKNDWALILLQMICEIAKRNSILLTTIQYKIIDANLVNPELIFFNGEVFYLNSRLIQKILDSPLPDVSIKYSDELKYQEDPEEMLFNQDIKTVNLELTMKLLILLVIADHACSHYFELNKKDYVNHKNFASHYFTLHSKLLLEPINEGKNLLKIATDCFNTNYLL